MEKAEHRVPLPAKKLLANDSFWEKEIHLLCSPHVPKGGHTLKNIVAA